MCRKAVVAEDCAGLSLEFLFEETTDPVVIVILYYLVR